MPVMRPAYGSASFFLKAQEHRLKARSPLGGAPYFLTSAGFAIRFNAASKSASFWPAPASRAASIKRRFCSSGVM